MLFFIASENISLLMQTKIILFYPSEARAAVTLTAHHTDADEVLILLADLF